MARGRTKAVALKRLKDKKLEYERSGRMPSQTTPYLKDWLDRWLDEIVKPRLRPSTLATYSSAAMDSNAAAGSAACVMGRPMTMCDAPLANAWAGVATRL